MENNVLGYAWFNSQTLVGVVLIENFDGKKAYIGVAKGENQNDDLQHIKDWGAKFPVEEATSLINKYGSFMN